ncbi:periplasmic binding protein-like I [Obelidium mucronatum]|nr:periplasmic binding protein-like I [Obelidium mucronatum]
MMRGMSILTAVLRLAAFHRVCLLALADKTQTSITFAFVGPYAILPNVEMNGSLVTNDPNSGSLMVEYSTEFSDLTLFYWNDVCARIAVDAINANNEVLPDTTINIKRFNNFRSMKGDNGGYAMQIAMDIQNNHPDVVAVFTSDLQATTTVMQSQIYSRFQLPTISASQVSSKFNNKNDYPYYLSMLSNSGWFEASCLLLNSWGVKRIAVIWQSSFLSDPQAMFDTLTKCNLSIVTSFRVSLAEVTMENAQRIGQEIEYYDARYVLIFAESTMSGFFYFTLGQMKLAVGPGYVWLGVCMPMSPGPLYNMSLINHFMFVFGSELDMPVYYGELLQSILDAINVFTEPYNSTFSINDGKFTGNCAQAFDAIGLLASGIDAVSNSTSPETVARRSAQRLLNFTAFMNTGYRGLVQDPIRLFPSGDMAVPYLGLQIDETGYVMPFAVTDAQWKTIIAIPGLPPPIFAGGTSMPPPDGRVYADAILDLTSTTGQVTRVLQFIGWLVCSCDMILVVMNRSNIIVRSSSVSFTALILVGAAIGYGGSSFIYGKPTPSSCLGSMWLPSLSFSIVASALIVKNARVAVIYAAKTRLPKIILTNWLSLLVFGCFMGVEMILLAFWSSLSKIHIKTIHTTSLQREFLCSYGSTAGTILEKSILVYHVLLVLTGICICVVIRNLNGIHSEMTYLTVILASTSLFTIINWLLQASSPSGYTQRLSQALTTWLILTVVIGLKFGSRAIELWYESTFTMQSLLSSLSSTAQLSIGTQKTASKYSPVKPDTSSCNNGTNTVLIISTTTERRKKKRTTVTAMKVVYRIDEGMFSKWMEALCTVQKNREKTLALFFPCEHGSSRAFNIRKESFHEVSAKSPVRLAGNVLVAGGHVRQVLVDFTSAEQMSNFQQSLE